MERDQFCSFFTVLLEFLNLAVLRPFTVVFTNSEVSFLHLYLSLFFLMEHLCHSEAICSGLWDLYEYMTGLANHEASKGLVLDT